MCSASNPSRVYPGFILSTFVMKSCITVVRNQIYKDYYEADLHAAVFSSPGADCLRGTSQCCF